MKLKLLVLLLMSGIIPYVAMPQTTQSATPLVVPSPQTWNFIKYGDTPVDLYTGTARVDIPLYTYSDKDFTIPISIGYASNGFMPAKQTGILGLNWFLNAGGMITREIRGVDDLSSDTWGESGRGFYIGENVMNSKYLDANLFNFNCVSMTTSPYFAIGDVETESDIYHFRFMGHSGTFHFDGQRNIRIYNTGGNHDTYKIELMTTSTDPGSYFTITTADGYKYLFGYNDRAVERSLNGNYRSEYSEFLISKSSVVSWMLYKITAPNGREVNFEYETSGGTKYISSPTMNTSYIVSFIQCENKLLSGTCIYKKIGVIHTTYLKRIKIDNDIVVSFDYSPKENREVETTSNVNAMYHTIVQKLQKLDAIKVSSLKIPNKILHSSSFAYSMLDLRTLLQSVTIAGFGNYKMYYYTNSGGTTFPHIASNALDFWGYSTGRTVLTDDYYSGVKQDSNGDETQSNGYKTPDAAYSIMGNLKRIEYPTHGYTAFEYEANTADKIVLKNKTAPYDFEINPPNPDDQPTDSARINKQYLAALHNYSSLRIGPVAGGVRVRRIIDSDAIGGVKIREFKYKQGIVLSFPKYYINRTNVMNPYLNYPRNTFDEAIVAYSSAEEIRADGARVKYDYSNYITNPDEYNGQQRVSMTGEHLPPTDPTFVNNILRFPNSHHTERAKLMRVTYYDNKNTPVKVERYKYARHNAEEAVDYSTFIAGSGDYWWSSKLFTGDYRMTDKTTVTYFDTDSIVVKEHLNYNNKGQIKTQITNNGSGREFKTNYSYAHENTGTDAVNSTIKDKNMIALPACISSSVYYNADNKEHITKSEKYDYALFGTTPQLYKAWMSDNIDPIPLSDQGTALNFIQKSVYDSYDSAGNITQSTDRNGIPTTYLWGYGGKYLIAKIENSTLSQVKTAVGYLLLPLQNNLTITQIEAIYSMPNVMFTHYEYKPHFGLTKITDPSRRITDYDYDDYGRLIKIRDQSGTRESYEYNF